MNSRKEQRFKVNQQAAVTVLGSPEIRLSGTIRDISKSGMRLILEAPVPGGSAIKIEWAEHILLGRVRYSNREGGACSAGVELFASWESFTTEMLERQAEELARSNAELEKFAYVAAHDLQEPLRIITCYLQLLAMRYRGRLDEDADEFICYAVDGANRMQSLISDLLSYAQVNTESVEFEAVDGEQVLKEAIERLRISIEERGALVTHDRLPVVPGDHLQLVRLLQNLISNGVKFNREQPPRVHLSADRKGKEWIFSVRDNGIGLDPQHGERIFEMFERLHGPAEYPGTGMGLALCKRIAERHGGRIWVRSVQGKGSVFYFTIPAIGDGARNEAAPLRAAPRPVLLGARAES